MISALDSSVILDVLTGSPEFADHSEAALRKALGQGQLIVGECVLAEIVPAFPNPNAVHDFMRDWQLEFVPSSAESAVLAGSLFGRHLKRGGRVGRVVADFLIGAHARIHADQLIARDRGFLRDYFRGLVVIDPTRR
ncbi:MAG: type II toxin-antitoxin system VapC family toxin [Lentisphaerae bacterium]|nr:type II toxin-antitoxin system VapC family toxin [Lentisphaerota bacterium]